MKPGDQAVIAVRSWAGLSLLRVRIERETPKRYWVVMEESGYVPVHRRVEPGDRVLVPKEAMRTL